MQIPDHRSDLSLDVMNVGSQRLSETQQHLADASLHLLQFCFFTKAAWRVSQLLCYFSQADPRKHLLMMFEHHTSKSACPAYYSAKHHCVMCPCRQ